MNDYLHPKEVAVRLRVHVSAVYRWIKRGRLLAANPAGRFLIRQIDVDQLLAPVQPTPQPTAAPQSEAKTNGR
jgi:excisionase family DNA binding protein